MFFLYAATAMPGLGWKDAPEFAVSSSTLGIAHPAGFPTFSLLTKVFTFLPFGGIPFRITLGVAFFQSAALFLMFRLIPVLTGYRRGELGAPPDQVLHMAAGGATLMLGLVPVMWTNATGIEVYGLNLLFLILILTCALKWIDTGRDVWLYAGGLIYGISAGNHATVVFFLPGLLLLVLVHARQNRLRRLLYLSFYFLVGFSVYLYLPIRAQAGPGFDFGYPINWERFFWHITDQKDSTTHFSAARGGAQFFHYFNIFLRQTVPTVFWLLGLPLAIVGAVRVWRMGWALTLAMISIAFFNMVFFIEWTDPVAFLPALLIAFIFIAVGLAVLVSGLSRALNGSPHFQLLIGALFAVIIIGVVTVQYPDRNRSKAFLSNESFRGDLESLPPEAICVSSTLSFHYRSYQEIFHMRPDVTVLLLSDFTVPEVFNPITQDRFPQVRVPAGDYDRFSGIDFLKKFLADNLDDRRDIFWQPNDWDGVFQQHLKPVSDMLFKFSPTPVKKISDSEAQAVIDRLTGKVRSEIQEDGYRTDPGLYAYYLDAFFNLNTYLRRKGRYEDGLAVMLKAEALLGPEGTNSLWPNNRSAIHYQIGKLYMDTGHPQEAEKRFRQAIKLVPDYYIPWASLGQLLLDEQRPEEALDALNRAAEIDPHRPEAVYALGKYYLQAGQRDKARNLYKRAFELSAGSGLADIIKKDYHENFVVSGGAH
jgi:tetratricopeptide (TPR) repeat protein